MVATRLVVVSSGPSPASTAPNGAASTAASDPARAYLDAVNALCDALLPKIVAVTHGGSIDVPVRKYLATWPAHKRLLDGFDAHLATVPVPAAQKGQAAYAKEVRSESGVENDPTIVALAAAGFNDSCTAR
jgi:hypothetical protein